MSAAVPTVPEAPPRLELNGPAPDFEANSTHGPIRLSAWNGGKWVILFSHPADFTLVCTYSHIAWTRNIEEKLGVAIKFPVIADLDQKVSRLYGMVHTPSAVTATVRCVFFIDPKRILRAMIYYPLNVGRNFDEIVRVIDALQTVDGNAVACPANWKPGDDVIVPAPQTAQAAEERMKSEDLKVTDWYLSKKAL